jgi:hypothetical protein
VDYEMKVYSVQYNYNSPPVKVRNVRLICSDDPDFIYHNKRASELRRQRRLSTTIPDNSLRSFEILSVLLEKSIFNWTNSSKQRIIQWEEYGYKNWKIKYAEVDFITEKEKNIFLVGEVKTTLEINHHHQNRGFQQLLKIKNLLQCIPDIKYELFLIRIFLIKNSCYNISEFESDLFNTIIVEKQHPIVPDFSIKICHLFGDDVFNYGIKNEIIKDPNLMKKALNELQYKNEVRDVTSDDILKLKQRFSIKM